MFQDPQDNHSFNPDGPHDPHDGIEMDRGTFRRMQEFFSRMQDVNEQASDIERVNIARERIKEAVNAMVGLSIFWSDHRGTDPQVELDWIANSIRQQASLTLSLVPTKYRTAEADLSNHPHVDKQEY